MDERGFISFGTKTLNAEPIIIFPDDFEVVSESTIYNLSEMELLMGKEFFGEHELINVEGSEVLRVENYEKAKFVIYANRNKPKAGSVPTDNSTIKNMTAKYEKYLDSIITRIEQDYRI